MRRIFILLTIILFTGCTPKDTEKGARMEDTKEIVELNEAMARGAILIDTRSYDEFNGWDLSRREVEGHIPGAYNIPAGIEDEKELRTNLERNGITREKTLILYGEGASELSEKLNGMGYNTSISTVDTLKWRESGRGLDSLKNKEMIVPVSWVRDLLAGEEVPNYDGRPVKVFNVGWDETLKTHKKGHIPGSYWVHTGWIEEGPLWNRVSDREIKEVMEGLGITKDTLVIVYGEDQTPAARFGIVARYMGVEDVRLMNGGLRGWKEAGYEISQDAQEAEGVSEFGADEPLHPEVIIDHEEAIEYLSGKDSDLISIRSWKEYLGKVSGYDYIKPRGRIMGAKWGMAGTDPWHLQDYRAADEIHMRPYNEILHMWRDLKIDTEDKLAFFCGTGWRASEVWFYAQAMGVEDSALYDGGWNEWSRDEKTKDKFLRGEPEKLNEEVYLD